MSSYDPTIESTHHKTIRFRKVHFATDIVDTAGMVCMYCNNGWPCHACWFCTVLYFICTCIVDFMDFTHFSFLTYFNDNCCIYLFMVQRRTALYI